MTVNQITGPNGPFDLAPQAGQRAEGAEAGGERYPGGRQSVAETIEDGFGSVWPKRCPVCEQLTMEVVRPGKAQCWANHKPLTQTDEYCSICREPMNLAYGENLFERKPFQRQNIWECHNDACPSAPTPSPFDAVAENEARTEVVEKTPEIAAPPVAEKTEPGQAGPGDLGTQINDLMARLNRSDVRVHQLERELAALGSGQELRETLHAIGLRLEAKAFPMTPCDTAEPCVTLVDYQTEAKALLALPLAPKVPDELRGEQCEHGWYQCRRCVEADGEK